MKPTIILKSTLLLLPLLQLSCNENNSSQQAALIKSMNLKRGEIISCGPPEKQLGSASFPISGTKEEQDDFNLGLRLLHSFEYDEAEKVFARIIDKNPDIAMAYWGIAMSNFHPLWTPPTTPELEKGEKALDLSKNINKPAIEAGFIDAIAAFYNNWKQADHRTRCLRFEQAMESLHEKYPENKEAAIFYALALDAAADPTDKTFQKQKKAGDILNALYPGLPDHPGIVHYIIHSYDYSELASLALPAARKYASVAPSSAHALHMPSHIFTRLGLWEDCINANLASVASAQCYAQSAGIKGHWDEELHGLDYLVYAYMQVGNNEEAKKYLDYVMNMKEVSPFNFKVAYAFASIPSRFVLENKMWKEAASLIPASKLNGAKQYWPEAIIHFTKLLGASHINQLDNSNNELKELNRLYQLLLQEKENYKAGQVAIQMKSGEAWIRFAEGKQSEALQLMKEAADMEDKTEKHPVTPGEVVPARELLGDMLMIMKKYDHALEAYEADLKKHTNRFNGIYGAAQAAEKAGNHEKAILYYDLLVSIAKNSKRPELASAKEALLRLKSKG